VRSRRIDLPEADLMFIDECHHARAATYQRLLQKYPHAILIGLTATPCRGDGRGLGNVFDVLIECPSVAELTRDGFLVPARIYAPSRPDRKASEQR
jgi:superfamily II DNA or RNA helicase